MNTLKENEKKKKKKSGLEQFSVLFGIPSLDDFYFILFLLPPFSYSHFFPILLIFPYTLVIAPISFMPNSFNPYPLHPIKRKYHC